MSRRLTDSQIVAILKETEAGISVPELVQLILRACLIIQQLMVFDHATY
jgi:hypothetical protein